MSTLSVWHPWDTLRPCRDQALAVMREDGETWDPTGPTEALWDPAQFHWNQRASFLVEQITAPKISFPVIISHIFNQTLIYWITAHGQQLWNILCNRKYLENWKFPTAQIRDWSGRAFQLPRSTATCWGWVMVTQLDRAWQGQQWTCHGNSVSTNVGNKDSQERKKKLFHFFLF